MTEADKYRVPESEGEVLPNLLGLTTPDEIAEAESRGVYTASLDTLNEVSSDTKFDLKYIYRIHRQAFEHLYPFAGKLRDVNVSKGGFVFPAAAYLTETMKTFEDEMLSNLPRVYLDTDDALADIARVHAELLFIHPFRANAMAARYGLPLFPFGLIAGELREDYINAVQMAAGADYDPMEDIFRKLLAGA